MALHLYDTRQRWKVKFEPLDPPNVRLYTCGPTVYNDAHIGNFRTYMFEDLLRRTLKFLGYQVTQVMNLTDIDDKTIRAAREQGVPLGNITEPIIKRFFEDLDALKIERAEVYPRATEHIPEMIAIIQTLMDKGIAYQAEGNVYYSIEKFANYGQLSGMNLESLSRGVRIDADEYEEKDNFRDFALWKGWTPDDGEVGWDSPWGRGRPGWHIECSAMSMKYLGEEFDIHTGGVDNIFPHHENEIAQSVAATGKGFVRYWLHSAHLAIEGEKMSKSLGNFYTVRELIDKGFSPRAIRYVLLTTHYRQRLNFTMEAVGAAKAALERLDTLRQAVNGATGEGFVRPILQEELDRTRQGFTSGLEDDLNIAQSLASLFDLVGAVHRLARAAPLNLAEGAAILETWNGVDAVLGVLEPTETGLPTEIVEAVRRRARLRRERNFAAADTIRGELTARSFTLEDAQGGTIVIWNKGRQLVENEPSTS